VRRDEKPGIVLTDEPNAVKVDTRFYENEIMERTLKQFQGMGEGDMERMMQQMQGGGGPGGPGGMGGMGGGGGGGNPFGD